LRTAIYSTVISWCAAKSIPVGRLLTACGWPALSGRHATKIGHRAYQHPERSGQDYGQEIDRFSALVIYLSLAALERDAPYGIVFIPGDNLIFVREDSSSRVDRRFGNNYVVSDRGKSINSPCPGGHGCSSIR